MSGSNSTDGQLTEAYKIIEELVERCDCYNALYKQQLELNKNNAVQNKKLPVDSAETKTTASKGWVKDAELEKILIELITTTDNYAKQLQANQKEIMRQKIQIDYLSAQNMRYKRLIERIKSKWYGKLLKKVYHFCCNKGIIKPF